MTDKERAERFKMALESIIQATRNGTPATWVNVSLTCKDIALVAIKDEK